MKGDNNPKNFINYRRVLSKSEAQLIRNELVKHYGADSIFLDSATILPGDLWEDRLEYSLCHSKS